MSLILNFLLLSIIICLILWIRFKIYQPLPEVLKKIKNLTVSQEDEVAPAQLFSDLPQFWNQVESEIQNVKHYFQDRQVIEDRIQKALKRLINYFPEPTIIVSPEARVTLVNRAFSEEFRHIERDEALPLIEVLREPEILDFFREDLQKKKAISREIKIKPPHLQTKKNYMVIKIPYSKTNKEGMRNVLMIFHDVTEIKRVDQMKTDFIQNVSHELRTPLTSIAGYLQVAKGDLADKDYGALKDHFEVIQHNVDRLNFLVQDLLQLSNLESDIELPFKSEDLEKLTLNVLKLFKPDFESGGYKATTTFEADTLYCDGRLVEQVLTNLLQNTLRYTPHGSTISIQWSQTPQNVQLHYKDNGPGIAAEHLPRLFERFYRVDSDRSRDRGGTGLGLSIVKHIMQRHRGSIEVQSELGKGVHFICVFKK